jgi:F-type H+-transporting ATPase subunit a
MMRGTLETAIRLPRRILVLALRRGFLRTAGLAILACLMLAAGSALANDEVEHSADHSTSETAHASDAGHAAHAPHHEPTPMGHVMDSRDYWEFFESIPILNAIPLPHWLSKFMVLEVLAALLIMVIYIPLGQRAQQGTPLKGWKDNVFEVLLTFVRDEIAKPSIGEHDADRYVPFLWTMFLFILFNNLLGIIPFGGSATASIYVTGALALLVFFAIHGCAIAKMGFGHYIGSLWPHIDLHWSLGLFIKPLIFIIDVIGVLVRNAVLAVRLFANMFAGHMVLATILIFIYAARNVNPGLWGAITLSSVLGIVALSLLEIFVAFLQAYIFVFLTALFMGMAMHPEH